MTPVPGKEAINQWGALSHILWLYIMKAYETQKLNEDLAIDKPCWADNVVFTFLLTATFLPVYTCLWACISKKKYAKTTKPVKKSPNKFSK